MKTRMMRLFAVALLSLALITAGCSLIGDADPDTGDSGMEEPADDGRGDAGDDAGDKEEQGADDGSDTDSSSGDDDQAGEDDGADARPASKTDTIAIEGMEEEHAFTLHEVPALGFSTYVIDDMEAETVSSGEGTAFRAYAGFGDKRSTEAMLEIFAPSGVDSVDDAVARKREMLAGTDRSMVEREEPANAEILGLPAAEYYLQGGGIFGSVTVFERSDRVYVVTIRYPGEYGDGFAPRAARLLADLEWLAE